MRTEGKSIPDIDFLERFSGRFALGSEKGKGSEHFLRFKIVGCRLTIEQAKVVMEIAEKYGRGILEVTTRGNIQVHWIKDEDAPEIFAKMDEVGLTTDMCGQGFPIPRYGDVRNITTCPVTGLEKGELMDTYPIVKELSEFFSGKPEYLDLPRKFKIAVTACPINCIRPEINDLALIAIKYDGKVCFTPFIGGRLGGLSVLAKPMNVLVEPENVLDFAKTIVGIYRDYGPRKAKATARFAHMVQEWGVDKIRQKIEECLGKTFKGFDASSLKLNWGDHVGVNEQKQKGLYYIVLPLPAGKIDVGRFKKLITFAEKHGYELRTSPLQKLIVANVPKGELGEFKALLRQMNFDLSSPYLRWSSIACPGDMCGKAMESPKEKVQEIEQHLEKTLMRNLDDLRIRIAISGCPNSCSHHKIAEIGLQSTIVKTNRGIRPAYDLFIKGTSSKLSQKVLTGIPSEEVKYVVERIIKLYLKSGFKDFEGFGEKLIRGEIKWS